MKNLKVYNKKKNANTMPALLKKYRINQDLSQAALSKALGYTSPQIISNIERGLCGIPIEKMKQYLQLINYPYNLYKAYAMTRFEMKLDKHLRKNKPQGEE